MSKRQPEPTKIQSHPLIGTRIKLVDHVMWKGQLGNITTVFNNGDVLAKLDSNITARAKEFEYEIIETKTNP